MSTISYSALLRILEVASKVEGVAGFYLRTNKYVTTLQAVGPKVCLTASTYSLSGDSAFISGFVDVEEMRKSLSAGMITIEGDGLDSLIMRTSNEYVSIRVKAPTVGVLERPTCESSHGRILLAGTLQRLVNEVVPYADEHILIDKDMVVAFDSDYKRMTTLQLYGVEEWTPVILPLWVFDVLSLEEDWNISQYPGGVVRILTSTVDLVIHSEPEGRLMSWRDTVPLEGVLAKFVISPEKLREAAKKLPGQLVTMKMSKSRLILKSLPTKEIVTVKLESPINGEMPEWYLGVYHLPHLQEIPDCPYVYWRGELSPLEFRNSGLTYLLASKLTD